MPQTQTRRNGRARSNGNGNGTRPPARPAPRVLRDPDESVIRLRRTTTANNPPDDLRIAEPSVDLSALPLKMWIGVPAALDPSEHVLLIDPSKDVPTGGAQYDVLSKASATDGDVEWQRMVRLGGDTMTGTLNINRRTEAMPPFTGLTAQRTALRLQGLAGTWIFLDSYGTHSSLTFRRANGTPDATVELPINALIGGIDFVSGHQNSISTGGSIQGYTREPWTATTRGFAIEVRTVEIGEAAERIQLQIGPAGVVIGQSPLPSGGLIRGELATRGVYVNGEKIGGFAPTVAWAADTDPDNVTVWINNSGRDLTITRISAVAEVANGSAADVTVVKAADGTPLSAGTAVHVGSFDADDPNPGTVRSLTPANTTLPIGWRLGLQADAITGWTGSVASITVYLD